MTRIIDLKSDTVTQPTREMREAMANAVVGDDFYHEDATVKELEELAAAKLGKEAAILVSSGTMGNLVSLLTHMRRGEVLIIEADAHIYRSECASLAGLAGVMPKRVRGIRGILNAIDVEAAVMPDGLENPVVTLLSVENTHNAAGGTCYTAADMRALRQVADKHGLAIHVDGARIFNASVSLGVDASVLAKDADSLTFCLSKGLSCPWGSLIVGTNDFIKRCRKNRQMVGGGMRQAGMMAAAGLVGLRTMVDRLAEDHANARVLAEGLSAVGMEVEMPAVQTNIVFFEVPATMMPAQRFTEEMWRLGVRFNPPRGRRIRMVTHYGITRDDIEYTIDAARGVTE
ncbi:MAG: GntG family PLP-dependent aldolase [Bacillota bacterium]|nr:GntG family PLP-dependent aldolase [Bacillota bacterium]